MRLAAGLRPDPLGEHERSPRLPRRNWGCLLLRAGGREGIEGDGKGEGRKGGGERKEEGRLASHTIFRPCQTYIIKDNQTRP